MTPAGDLEQLFDRARSGDARALHELLERQRSQVIRYAMRLCVSPEDAQDATQEALLALARYLAALRQVAALSSWLFTAVRTHCTRLARRSLRRRFRADAAELDTELDAAPSPEDLFVDEQLRQRLSHVLAGLELHLREVLVRRDILGEPSEEVARALDLTREAMKSRLHRARSEARRRLLRELAADRPG